MSDWPGPHFPDVATQSMPESVLDAQVQNLGIRLGWMKSHVCPCTYAVGQPGSPDPGCKTCLGRGVYWDQALSFLGHITYMHTSSAPDEPGAMTGDLTGHTQYAEPTLTIPKNGNLHENQVWQQASDWDAFVQYDSNSRFNSTLVVGQTSILPYQWGVQVMAVTAYDVTDQIVVPVSGYAWNPSGQVTLPDAYDEGTAYTVEYFALSVFVAYRKAGGHPHTRPFAAGRTGVPRRFHLMVLDEWLRARGAGESPGFGQNPPKMGWTKG